MFNKSNKNIFINKAKNNHGEFKQTNKIILNAYINRIDKSNYDYKVLEDNNSYKIIVSRKIESV